MDWFVKAFIKTSLTWLFLGVTIGMAMALSPSLAAYRLAHLHLNLLGFVVQMIYGLALHVVPRFFGQPLASRRLADAQFWLAQAGLVLLVTGFTLRVRGAGAAAALVSAGALASTAAAYAFIWNLWRTIDLSSRRVISARDRAMPLAEQGG